MILLKKNKKLVAWSLLLFILIIPMGAFADDIYEGTSNIPVFSESVEASVPVEPPKIDAGSAIVMDAMTGRVLYEKDAYSKKPIASTTKIMTAILAIEHGNLDDMVTVSKRAAAIGGSTIHLRAGEKLSLRDLLYGLMLNSGNDAAIAIAEHIGGTVERFAEMMTEKARQLGAKNTNFKTPHGLDNPDHYSTAYDLALITRYALGNETFNQIVRTQTAQIQGRSLYNTNEMLDLYPGADGVKTGYTSKAGRCLVTSATRGNRRYISVVLNCSSRTARAKSSRSILDYAFDNYKMYTLVKINDVLARVPVIKGIRKDISILPVDEIHLPLREDEVENLKAKIDLPDQFHAPVDSGIEVGSIKYVVNGKVIASTSLKTGPGVRRKEFFDYFLQVIEQWVKSVRISG